jgi:A/G-specific adenine glycosylase
VNDRIVEPLLRWAGERLRDLPWRRTRDPWCVLVSEVMSQQTGIDRVVPKYLEFVARFPTPLACASAPLGEALALWSGLGYPRRCRNLHDAARVIVDRHNGSVPLDLDTLLALPGVGPYTARAVLSFAAGRDVGVVDTNVARVLARLSNRVLGARDAQAMADALVPSGRSWEWNQAFMDLGSTVCRARVAACDECPVATWCTWGDGPDPAPASALTSKPQARFEGSNRQARGRLMRRLAVAPQLLDDVPRVMGLVDQPHRARVLLDGLVTERLVVIDADRCRLP